MKHATPITRSARIKVAVLVIACAAVLIGLLTVVLLPILVRIEQ
jgi:hypothetical protein